jgi:kynureninase
MSITRAALEALDREDPLADFRDRFALPEGVLYMDGNSLGARPRGSSPVIKRVVEREWGDGLIRSWNDASWMDMPGRVGAKIGTLLGAEPDSVMVADSTSVNLFKMLGAALGLRPDRKVILSERGNFPTDLYIAEGLIALLGRGHELRLVEPGEVMAAIDDRVAVAMLTHVNYHTGAMYDMAAVTARAHEAGALALWDLAHSAGAVPVDLAGAGADLAVGCGYKFLNGGPGAPAFFYVAPRHQTKATYPLTGWLGHAAPFAFEGSYRPAEGIHRAIVGTPPVISLAALEVGVEIALEADMALVRAKSLRQSAVFAELVTQECAGHGLRVITPDERGSQVSVAHPQAYEIMQALIERGLIGDFRAPDVLRFGVTPLYFRYVDVWDAVSVLAEVMASGVWRDPRYAVRKKVT